MRFQLDDDVTAKEPPWYKLAEWRPKKKEKKPLTAAQAENSKDANETKGPLDRQEQQNQSSQNLTD